MSDDARGFYPSLPILTDFAAAVRAENYRPAPDDWVLGFADVVGSTRAIAEGRYKAVNFVGAGVIAAVSNALDRRPFPFIFGGDGASFATSGADAAAAGEPLARMVPFAKAAFGLDLRVASVPVAEVRAAGRDVWVGRFAASEPCVYAMFSGGGLTGFEDQAKRGRSDQGLRPLRHAAATSDFYAHRRPTRCPPFSILLGLGVFIFSVKFSPNIMGSIKINSENFCFRRFECPL